MENVRKHINIKFATTKIRMNYLISEPNYQRSKLFLQYLLEINKPVCSGLSILEICKINLSMIT